MFELAHADTGRIPVAAEPEGLQGVIGEDSSGGQRRHPTVQPVKTKGPAEKIGRALARAADAAEFHQLLRDHVHLVHDLNDLVGDRFVATALAQRTGCTPVIILGQANLVSS